VMNDHFFATAANIDLDTVFRRRRHQFSQIVPAVGYEFYGFSDFLNCRLKPIVRRMNFRLADQLIFQWDVP